MLTQLRFQALAWISLSLLLLTGNIASAQQTDDIVKKAEAIINKPKSPQSEVEDAILFLADRPEYEREYIRFFTTYAMQDEVDRENSVLVLSWLCHSLTGVSDDPDKGNAGGFKPIAKRITIVNDDGSELTQFVDFQRVPDSTTLWWIDIRDYNWTPQAWEKLSTFDGYFAEPIVQHDRSGALKLLAGNAVVRADWFIVHASDQMKQRDIKGKETIYELLLYAQSKRPNNLQEWEKLWGLNYEDAISKANESYTLVTKSKVVTRHNRILGRFRTYYGDLYKTWDVISQTGRGDYVSSFFLNDRIGGEPDKYNAGEMFANNVLQGWVYGLYQLNEETGVDEIVDFGDPAAVRHVTDVVGDTRVRNAHSCFDCHAAGPIPPENTILEFLERNKGIYLKDKFDEARLSRNYLSLQFEDSIKPAQDRYAKFVERCNGLTPEENGSAYLQIVEKYDKPLDIKQQAFECGVSIDVLTASVRKSKFAARTKLTLDEGEPIPRDVWETITIEGIPGSFQQAMIAIHGITLVEEVEYDIIKAYKVIKDSVYVKGASDAWKTPVENGIVLRAFNQEMKQNAGYYRVFTENGDVAFIHSSDVEIVDTNLDKTTIFSR